MSRMSQISMYWCVANVSFSNFTLGKTFKLADFTTLENIKDEIHHLLPYRDNRKIVKLGYHSLSIDNKGNIDFSKFELKTRASVRTMWDTFFYFKEKVSLELEATLQRSIEDIQKMCKHPPGY